MDELPKDVRSAKDAISRGMYEEWSDVADKLIVDSPELVAMWRKIEELKYPDEPPPIWVWHFLGSAFDASSLPPYHYKSKLERRELSENIHNCATGLANALKVNGLDVNFVKGDDYIFEGFFVYEDFGDSNRARIDARGEEKLPASYAITQVAKRAIQKIADEPMPGKVGANVKAVRFVRLMATNNQRTYGETLNTVIATAANAIFGIHYTSSDVSNLLSR